MTAAVIWFNRSRLHWAAIAKADAAGLAALAEIMRRQEPAAQAAMRALDLTYTERAALIRREREQQIGIG